MIVARYEAFDKIMGYIESCKHYDQLAVCEKMLILFHQMYFQHSPNNTLEIASNLANAICQRKAKLLATQYFG